MNFHVKFRRLQNLPKENGLRNLQRQMELLVRGLYHEKRSDKTPRSFSCIITQQSNDATMKEKQPPGEDSRSLQGLSETGTGKG